MVSASEQLSMGTRSPHMTGGGEGGGEGGSGGGEGGGGEGGGEGGQLQMQL